MDSDFRVWVCQHIPNCVLIKGTMTSTTQNIDNHTGARL